MSGAIFHRAKDMKCVGNMSGGAVLGDGPGLGLLPG